jgi:hypothetical protein
MDGIDRRILGGQIKDKDYIGIRKGHPRMMELALSREAPVLV